MPVPADVRLEARILLETGGQVITAYQPSEGTYVLPGGAVDPSEGVGTAAARHAHALTGFPSCSPVFAGCVEHTAPEDRTVITVLFAADLPHGSSIPSAYLGAPLVPLVLTGIDECSLTPTAVAKAAVRWLEDRWPTWRGLPVADPEPWWNQLRQSAQSLRAQLQARRRELDDVAFRDAAVAVCALVAAADGTMDTAERNAMKRLVTTDGALTAFPSNDLVRLFDAHMTAFQADATAGRAAALQQIAKVRGHGGRARAVVQFGAAIGRADGAFKPGEQDALAEVIDILGLDRSFLSIQAVRPDA